MAPAAAPPYTAPVVVGSPDAAHEFGFVTMGRLDAESRVGGDVSYIFPDHVMGDLTALRFDVHGHYVDQQSGLGGYVQMPFAYVSASGGGMSQSFTPTGDLEAGMLYVPHLSSPDTAIVLNAGLTLPTASSSLNDAVANLVASGARFTDYYQIVPEGFSLRVGGAVIVRSGTMFARFEGGIDANLSAANNAKVDTIMRVNAGIGLDLGQVALMGESANIYDSSASGSDSGSSWINVAAVSVRMRSGSVEPYGAVTFPLDRDANTFMSAALTVGLESRLGHL